MFQINSEESMIGLIPVENSEPLVAVQGFLKSVLESEHIEALYVPMQVDGGAVVPALVTDPERLSDANPLAPSMSINGARAVSALTGKDSTTRLGAVLRPCEIRALFELVKLQQASLDGLTIISLDCPGTYELPDYSKGFKQVEGSLEAYLLAAQEGTSPALDGLSLRQACQMCVHPTADSAQISLHLFGVDTTNGIPVVMDDVIAERLGMMLPESAQNGKRQEILERLVAGRFDVRQKELASIRSQLASNGGMPGLFSECIRCHNCMTVCPVCYCKTCLFKTAAFDHPPEHYMQAARPKGALRMPGDTLLFHMTRLNHMSASCVSCGMCTSACPANISVGAIFSAIGEQVAAAFDYVPGRDPVERLPLVTFQANELTQVGEAR